MTKKLVILGSGEALVGVVALAELAAHHENVVVLELLTEDQHVFTLPDLTAHPREDWQIFVALDARGLNMARTQVVSELKAKGYKLAHLIAPDAILGANVMVGENCLVGRGCHIGHGTKIVFNSFISDKTVIGNDCVINKSCFVGKGAIIDDAVTIADNAIIGAGVHLQEGAKVGKQCELRHRKSYSGTIADKTFYLDLFPNPIEIIMPL